MNSFSIWTLLYVFIIISYCILLCVWHITWCRQVEAGSGDEIDGAASDAGGNKSDDEDDDKDEVDEDVELDEDDLEEVSHLLILYLLWSNFTLEEYSYPGD